MLGKVDLFSGMSPRHLKKLVTRSREVVHNDGHQVSAEGQGGLAFHLVLDGSAKVERNGRELRALGPGDYFGEITMIDGKPRSATVTASGQLKTLAIPHSKFEELLEEEPGFARHLLEALCARLRESEAARG
jgi:CRP/FNR family cyclic AMP-dependent transcriptional regulator